MRAFCAVIVFGLSLIVVNSPEAKADCHLEGHPICNKPCKTVCRAFYDPGPPESCETECKGFLVPNDKNFTLKLEGVTEDQKNKINAILNPK